MEISEIKKLLTLSMVLHYYHLKADKNNRIRCPFHEDKTPSLQLYWKTHTAYCFSSNCKTHGKSMDVIDFIMYMENCDKHTAILKAKEILGYISENKSTQSTQTTIKPEMNRTRFLANMYQYFLNAVHNSKPAQEYIQSRGLDYRQTDIGYNAGQFHHSTRKDDELINRCIEYGLLIDRDKKSRTGGKAYQVFGKYCISFVLRDRNNEIVSLYFRSTLENKEQRHFYLKDRQGLYPHYPKSDTTKLILTESIIDAASLLQIQSITDQYSILACYGTNGLTAEHQQAIKELKHLEEIILIFDNDGAGRESIQKYSKLLKAEYPKIRISTATPVGKDINETLQSHSPEIFAEILNNRTEFFISPEHTTETTERPKSPVENTIQITPSTPVSGEYLKYLKGRKLVKRLNELIGKSGIVGEDNSRMLLFLITISYKNGQPLHALVQGSSGSGKTHLINRIADLMPPEVVLRFTRVTESSLYNWGEFDLCGKVLVFEDMDGLKEDALYALREFITNQILRSSVTIKDKRGNNKSSHKIVQGQFSSLAATTKGETYEDNMSRSFLIAVDESKDQTQRIIDHQNKKNAGLIKGDEVKETIRFIQELVRSLKHYEVVNPYAPKLQLPEKVHKVRRLNEMYQAVIKQVTLLNQYQRKTDSHGRLITEIEDIEQATEILFESIVLKVDELDGSLRQFFERLKKYLKEQDRLFTQREIRQELNISKAQCSRFINQLIELEYITSKFGGNLKKISYRVDYWDNHTKFRAQIKDFLNEQIKGLKQ